MKPTWEIDKATTQRWREFVDANINNQPVKDRRKRNVARKGINLSKVNLWKSFVSCQVTTQQRSGPGTPVSRFMQSNSLALKYQACRRAKGVEGLLEREFAAAGLWRTAIMASNLASILAMLEAGEWKGLLRQLRTLKSNTTRGKEVKVAQYLQSRKYPGLGPKQSRNFIQRVGLSRYEIPLDSRILKKLKEFGCSFVPRATALSDETVYRFVQSGLQQIAESLEMYPCVLDACIFSGFDKKDA
jgi:hypothetical protein